jgi:hypothetical protein
MARTKAVAARMAANPATRPGWLTTEFWAHNVLQVLLTLNDFGVWSFCPPKYAVIAQAILGAFYYLGRGWAKSNPGIAAIEEAILVAEGELPDAPAARRRP